MPAHLGAATMHAEDMYGSASGLAPSVCRRFTLLQSSIMRIPIPAADAAHTDAIPGNPET